jgi:hypothetical protein
MTETRTHHFLDNGKFLVVSVAMQYILRFVQQEQPL